MERAYRIWKSSHLISSILKAYELVSVITQDDVVEEATDDLSSEVLGLKVVDEHAQMEELGQMLNQLENNMPNVDQVKERILKTHPKHFYSDSLPMAPMIKTGFMTAAELS
jgi:hypothetical protein